MADNNIIPSINAAGSFTALAPFDKVVDPSIYYTVVDVSTINNFQTNANNLYSKMFEPIGVAEADYPTVLSRALALNAVVVTLSSKNNPDIYVLTNFFSSFPLVDGVVYENISVVASLGAVPPGLKNVCNTLVDHLKSYIQANLGIANPVVFLGSVPTKGYVSKDDADTFESTRQAAINLTTNDVSLLNQATTTIDKQRTYILELEAKVEAYAQAQAAASKSTASGSTTSTDNSDSGTK